MKKLFLLTYLLLSLNILYGQTDSKKNYLINTIAFYNVENLFDTINDPKTWDDDRTPKGKDRWTSIIYNKKIENIAKVIADIGSELTNSSPSIIGLCEIENKRVLIDLLKTKSLINENYGIVHFDSPDERGVDVAMLFKINRFKPKQAKAFPLFLKKSNFIFVNLSYIFKYYAISSILKS